MERYQHGQADRTPQRRRRRRAIYGASFGLSGLLIAVTVLWVQAQVEPRTTLTQATATTKRVDYTPQTKRYNLDGFSIAVPAEWQLVPRPAGPYQTYTWQYSEQGTNGVQLQIYKDTIPANFAVNRVITVEAAPSGLRVSSAVSDNCSTFTKNISPVPNRVGAPARWQGIDFLCDQANPERDVIGTSSKDGINTVALRNAATGQTNKFFFTYTNYDISPDYSAFTAALSSFKLQ